MDKDTKFALLVVGIPLLGLGYCALMLAVMFLIPDARQHPIIIAALFVLAELALLLQRVGNIHLA